MKPSSEVIAVIPADAWRAFDYSCREDWWFQPVVDYLKTHDPVAAVKALMLGPRGTYPEWADGPLNSVNFVIRRRTR